jgi:CheY-like chemotaxis protein
MELSFIIIDDIELDHFIARKIIGHENEAFAVKSFLDSHLALAYIANHIPDPALKKTLVFLDIYMPLMDGFQFMEEFEQLPPAIQDRYYFVALTSFHDSSDGNRIKSYSAFKGMIAKPITPESIKKLLKDVCRDCNIQL